MTGNIAFDIVIGLVFTYLLYSLYATILMELVSSLFGLRAKNLRYTLKRMLKDEKQYPNLFVKGLADIANTFSRSIGLSVNLKNKQLYKSFLNQPSIKYLGSGGFGGKPSYLSADNFSKGIIDGIKEKDTDFSLMIAFASGLEDILPDGSETKSHIKSLMEDANNDPIKFRILLETWFDNTMERSSGWFKQTTQILLLFIGMFIVVSFNVDTLQIINKLSTDKDAREQLVKMATDFNERNAPLIAQNQKNTDSSSQALKERLDSLNAVKQMLAGDIQKSQSILSAQWALQGQLICQTDTSLERYKDSVRMFVDQGRYINVHHSVDTNVLRRILPACKSAGTLNISVFRYKLAYAFSSDHFLGFLLSILALSLGAPFWFDLLNKLVKLRTSAPADGSSGATGSQGGGSPGSNRDILNRVG